MVTDFDFAWGKPQARDEEPMGHIARGVALVVRSVERGRGVALHGCSILWGFGEGQQINGPAFVAGNRISGKWCGCDAR